MRRSFLLLQGTASPFFGRLAVALTERGHTVRRVNFCGGDALYGGGGDAWNFTSSSELLPDWYSEVLAGGEFTDVLMFGDCRPIHRPVHAVAKQAGVGVRVFEEGYVRPNWLTLEQHGVNGRSLLPRDPAWYLERRAEIPASAPGQETGYNLRERAFHDIRYRLANALYAFRFPHYRSHRPQNGFVEYAGLASRALKSRWQHRHADEVTRGLLESRLPYYLFPLQLNSDTQIVIHSEFDGVRHAIERVMRSFASHAPIGSCLVIKNHPLDTGLIDYRRYAQSLARELDIEPRLRFIDAGHLPTLLDHALGVVLVNSTVGLSALHHRRPLIALGDAIYDIPGLTWQQGLHSFWSEAEPPDMALYQAFLNYVIHHTQINGDFYTRRGIAMAVSGTVRRLEASHV
ncbi:MULTISPECIES: capsule biosynthesis protein [Burkholderia]|uniref:capsule biosynthesis protein n=1 Tax=Burkholderia TaxID=32008 RepID=UPI00064FA5F4|nr:MULTISPECIES: capsular biosynthesis protein [Burkholderia]KML11326.1 capsular biosynthesis protein [Burkholderia cepacia]KML43150.1 capsular biosynthesis protein [Burkholderia lata]KMN59715.1 capsular biosynthesis protein [Burkholderia sp. LK4]